MTSAPISESGPTQGLNGDSKTLAVNRAINELKHGRFVAIVDRDRALVFTALETAPPTAIDRLSGFAGSAELIVTAERASAIGARVVGPIAIPLSAFDSAAAIRAFAGLEGPVGPVEGSALPAAAGPWTGSKARLAAAFRLAKAARTIPALIGAETAASAADGSIARVALADVERIARSRKPALDRISACRVPLIDAEESVVTLFRDPYDGAEHVAVTIGTPDPAGSVPVRLHSACLTGDVLGSLRCDCGEQLRIAVRRIAELGGGVLLYLDQEGRGIGLANKLRAYTIQDAGLDTLDADRHLGFRADERSYGVAAAMLDSLGIERIELLTNNPQKIAALQEFGIDVAGRQPLVTATNVHNERYLRAKRERAGHLSEDTGS